MTDEFTRLLSSARPVAPSRPSTSGLRVSIAIVLLLVCLAVVLWVTMSPTPINLGREDAIRKLLAVLHDNGVPLWFGYSKLEFTANIVMFVPLGLLIGLALPQRGVWLGLLLAPAFSAAIELAQALLLSQRTASVLDVVANSLGGWAGLLIAVAVRAVVHARDRRVVAQSQWDQRWRSR